MSYTWEDFYTDVWNDFVESSIADEYLERNQALIESIIHDFYLRHELTGCPDPRSASEMLRIIFSNIYATGLR